MIPLFDSLAHPTISGTWFGRAVDAGFERLARNLGNNGYCRACAVGLSGVEGYDAERFMTACKKYEVLYPVAGIEPSTTISVQSELAHLIDLGYRAVKVHPRYSKMTRRLPELQPVFECAAKMNVVVFYCTYVHTPIGDYPIRDPLYDLVDLLKRSPSVKVVLVHGGDVNLMRYAELARFNDNLLLDLSLTMMKYEGSSLDADIQFLFERFDRRICLGSDHPEYDHTSVRRRFEQFSDHLPSAKAENVGFRNLVSFLGLEH